MEIFIDVLKIVLGFVLLIKGADFFVDGSAAIAKKAGVPQIVIGLTIVALGTSAPEAAVSISAAVKGNNGISIGNVLGSNIMNIMLILGIAALISVLTVKKDTIKVDIPFLFGCTILLVAWGMIGGRLTRITGVIFILLLAGYTIYLIRYSKTHDDEGTDEIKDVKLPLIPVFILGGLGAIVLGSNIAVAGASSLATVFGVSQRVIGLTIVAFGTSLPELVTSVVAARKGNVDIAIGNIVGSNLFNILLILGITSILIDLPYTESGANFTIDGYVAILAVMMLWIFTFKNKKLGKVGGVLMLLTYAAYFTYLFVS